MNWQQTCVHRLHDSRHGSGGWPYRPASTPCAEPTALACLALLASDTQNTTLEQGLAWLTSRQRADGGIPATGSSPDPCWTTALACIAWASAQGRTVADFSRHCSHAIDWLLRTEGVPFRSNPAIYGHNTRLTGWPWVDGTHSWVEPTAYALLALRTAGQSRHARYVEAVKLLLDRALQSGGWNYGNSVMFGSELRAFPAQTGMVLAALKGQQRGEQIDKGLQFLLSELPRVRSPFSLGWGLIGLAAWGAQPAEADSWLSQCAAQCEKTPADPIGDALLILASAKSPLTDISRNRTNGT